MMRRLAFGGMLLAAVFLVRLVLAAAPGDARMIEVTGDGAKYWPRWRGPSGQGLVAPGQYTETWNAIDLIAERIRSLGEYAPGTYREYARLTRIKETEGVPRAEEMVKLLIEGQEAVVRTARETLGVADEANDQPTLDLLTQRMQAHEKNAWMLRSLLKK